VVYLAEHIPGNCAPIRADGQGQKPYIAQSLAAAGRFLEEGELNTNKKLTLDAAMWFIKIAQARPPGWTEMHGGGTFPGTGPGARFERAPFRLTLIRAIEAPNSGRALGGWSPTRTGLYERAVLSRSGPSGLWEWTLSSRTDNTWEEHSRIALR
jgi:hypothetical protein